MADIDFRTRLMALMVYGEEEEIDLFLSHYNSIILHFAYIKHDKDVTADGKPIEPHFHLCLYLKTNYYISFILEKIKEITHQNALGEVLSSKGRMYNYLIHRGKPDKFQYSRDEIISDNSYFWLDQAESSQRCIYDIINGADTMYLLKEYGNFFFLHSDKFYAMARKIREESNIPTTKEVIADLNSAAAAEVKNHETLEN